ncbi:ATP-grasp domain-containing protein [Castellaniella sp.]|uniref:ATP-grasp domain-containing protein n=1 Tax=Castellaniella sp. TaxID=1955812 RepID=UPI003C74B4A7
MSTIFVIHENNAWVEPLREAFKELGLDYEEWFLDEGVLDFSSTPPEGVFYNRMSASSHTRGHRYGPEYTAAVLAWLESYDRTVVNDSRALRLEVSKIAQYAALRRYGIRTPRTLAAVGAGNIVAAARKMPAPFITKHNRAGKGLGVHLFHDVASLERYVASPQFEESVDGVTLIQEYIQAPEPCIARAEFIGGEFLYAVRVDTSQGFELCPADVCQIGDLACPVGGETAVTHPRFEVIPDFRSADLDRYRRFMQDHGVGVTGIESIVDARGVRYTYDVNTNTNYNSEAEQKAGLYGMRTLAAYLGRASGQLAARELAAKAV